MSCLEAQLHVVADRNKNGKPVKLNQDFFQFGFFEKQERFCNFKYILYLQEAHPNK